MKTLERDKSGILKKIMYVTLVGLLVVQMTSCDKDTTNDNQSAKLTIRMTDAPANYDAVNIDVQGVEVTGNGGTAVMLTTTAKVYNLLELSNGVNALIATGDVNAGTISQIRLILGSNNSVTVGGVTHPLTTPSAMQSGLKLQVNKTFEAGVEYSMLLDFDASQSIVVTGNNEYQLKPVIRTIDTAISGSIKGSVSPLTGNVLVAATSNGVTYTSVTAANGSFLISGLPLGSYDIVITPALPLLPITLTGKAVVVGASTDLGITILL
jgi:hypothetical protein